MNDGLIFFHGREITTTAAMDTTASSGDAPAPSDFPPVPADTKDWTWVVDEPCPACGFVPADVDPSTVGPAVRAAVPRYVRVLHDPPTTGTNKIVKRELVRQKVRHDLVDGDELFVRDGEKYRPFTADDERALYEALAANGRQRFWDL